MKPELDIPAQISLHLMDDEKEYMLLSPSYYILEFHANKLLELIKKWKTEVPEVNILVLSLERKIDIYKADLPGHLKSDLKKGNKRYRDKWIVLKNNIDGMRKELLTLWKQHYNL
jgi:hypothetical protein